MSSPHQPRHNEATSEPIGPRDGSGHTPDDAWAPRSGESIETPGDTEEAEREVPDAQRTTPEDESADPVGDGHSDADLADQMPRP